MKKKDLAEMKCTYKLLEIEQSQLNFLKTHEKFEGCDKWEEPGKIKCSETFSSVSNKGFQSPQLISRRISWKKRMQLSNNINRFSI